MTAMGRLSAPTNRRRSLAREAGTFVRTARRMHKAGMPMFHPTRIAEGLRGIVQDPNDTRHVFTLFESMIGPFEVVTVGRWLRSEQARDLFSRKPPVLEALTDRERLRRMPEGSLGRAYLAFVEAEGISADGLIEASLDGRISEHVSCPELSFMREYMRDTHDLWHTVTGYKGDLIGELSLLAFGFAQMGNLGVAFLITVALLISGASRLRGVDGEGMANPQIYDNRDVVIGGFVRGLRARWVPTTDWLAMLEMPIDEVRAQLRVGQQPTYDVVRAPTLAAAA